MRETVKRTGAALAASVLLAFVCGWLVYGTTGFVYAIADDVIMRDIASGAFTGTPDGHLFFVQYALGRTISSLYRINGRADWYGFFMAGAVFLSLAAILYRGLAAKKSWKWKGVYCVGAVGVTLTALLSHAAQFEWTISAAALGAAALFLYVSAGRRKTGLVDGVWIWMLLILTYGIRSDVFFMVLPGFGLAFLWKAFQKNENGNKWKINFRELLLERRIREAKVYLKLHRNHSITQIATLCGFHDSNYFSTCFHRLTGVSPRQYRESGRD